MKIVQITPGAGGMYCGGCFRDNALVGALRKQGHSTLMIPLYLPMTLDEEDHSNGTPIFFGGINVYLEQKSAFFRKGPAWLHCFLNSPRFLKWAAGSAAKTRAQDVGELTLSMVRGEEGNQLREIDQLIAWLKTQPRPDMICLSNALLLGMVRKIKKELRVPVACLLAGEDAFLDGLPDAFRAKTWVTLEERASEVDLFIAPTRYFGNTMRNRLNLVNDRVRILPNGINLDGFAPAHHNLNPPVLGYFARMCRDKGLDLLAEAYILIRQRGRIKDLKLLVGGGMGPTDEPLVRSLQKRFAELGFSEDVEFHSNLDRKQKQEFLRSVSVLSVPAMYGEAFGLYIIEALAAGVPVVQPRHASFPEMIEMTGGGVLCEPTGAKPLADAIEALLLDPARARTLGEAGRRAVYEKFSIEHTAKGIVELFEEVRHRELVPVG